MTSAAGARPVGQPRFARHVLTRQSPWRLLLATVSLGAVLYGVAYVVRYQTSDAFFDSWLWVSDFQRWVEHQYTVHDLIKPHYGDQHRIATTRLLMLPDSIWLGMHGVLPSSVNLFMLGALGLMVARLVRVPELPWLFWVALFVSSCQGENLIFPMQVQFAIAGVAACGALSLFAAATEAQGRRAVWLSISAGFANVAAILSMASGLLVLPALVAVAWLRRARATVSVPALLIGGFAICLALIGYHPQPGPSLTNLAVLPSRIDYVTELTATAFTAVPAPRVIGAAGLLLFGCSLLWAARHRPISGDDAALLGLAIFVVGSACGGATTGRVLWPHAGFAQRYSTMGLMFLAAMVGFWVHRGAHWRRLRARTLVIGAVFLLVVLNLPAYRTVGAAWRRVVQSNSDLTVNNVGVNGATAIIFGGNADQVRSQIAFLHRSHLNMFDPVRRPSTAMLTAVARADPAHLPACRGWDDMTTPIDDHAVLVTGWMATPDGSRNLDWVLARERTVVIGATKPLGERLDVEAALHRQIRGFQSGFRLRTDPPADGSPRTLMLFGALAGATAPACVLASPLIIGPILFPLLDKVRIVRPVANTALPWALPVVGLPVSQGEGQIVPEGWIGQVTVAVQPPPAGLALALPIDAIHTVPGRTLAFTFPDGASFAAAIPTFWERDEWHAALLPASLIARHPGPIAVAVNVPAGPPLKLGAPLAVSPSPDWSRLFDN